MARLLIGMVFGSLVAVAGFGAILAPLWAVIGDAEPFKLLAVVISALLAMIIGGLAVTWIAPHHRLWPSILFGLLFGGFSFAYILGAVPGALLAAIASAFASAAGSLIFRAGFRNEREKKLTDAG